MQLPSLLRTGWAALLSSLLFLLLPIVQLAPLGIAQAQPEYADLALINGVIWTANPKQPQVEAVAVRGTQILRVGSNAQIKAVSNAQTRVIDLQGKFVAPGFNDAHIHFLGGAQGLTEVDLTGTKSVAEMTQRVVAFAKANPQAQWITGRGWEYTYFPGGLPQRRDLDAVVADRPVFLRAYDGHSAWANSKAIQLAEITKDTKFDGFGEIVRDAQGEPTGAFKEGAQRLVTRLIPEPTREQKLAALRAGMKLAATLGITSLQNASGSVAEFSLYEELLQRGELTIRLQMAFSLSPQTTPAQIAEWVALKNRYTDHPQLQCSAVKFVLDGVIESHTAAMHDPYSDLPSQRGELSWQPAAYQERVAQVDQLGFQIMTHAIGDRAVTTALNAYEHARRQNGRRDARHRVEHIESVKAADIARFAKLGVLASMEPIHADPRTIEVWAKAVGAEREQRAFAWRAYEQKGATLVFSSDWPASIALDPLRGLHSAVNRQTTAGQPAGGWLPQWRVTAASALRAYTQAGAYAQFKEKSKGQIVAGQQADLVALSQNLLTASPAQIHQTKVVLTIFAGKTIYEAK